MQAFDIPFEITGTKRIYAESATEAELKMMQIPSEDLAVDGERVTHDPRPVPPSISVVRRHKLPPGECKYCDEEEGHFHPPHDASSRCESGKHAHCSCDTCF